MNQIRCFPKPDQLFPYSRLPRLSRAKFRSTAERVTPIEQSRGGNNRLRCIPHDQPLHQVEIVSVPGRIVLPTDPIAERLVVSY